MFTGLIEDVGQVARVTPGPTTRLAIRTSLPAAELTLGESIACDGVCLTVAAVTADGFEVDAAPETLRRSTLSTWQPGSPVNLERSLRLGDRLGGHWVQGHVDGVATVLEARADGGSWAMHFSLSPALAPLLVEKGSICLDGVSLTLTGVGKDTFAVMLIPETMQRTHLGRKGVGSQVNVEADILAKHVQRLLAFPRPDVTA